MSMMLTSTSQMALPAPRVAIGIRAATMADLPFLDVLQKQHNKALGYFPTKQFEGYIAMGGILLAEDAGGAPLGYCISRDRYLKRDELGVIYQLCVVPGEQRKLVGASLVQAAFERAAYGCRLFCCWCAQDLAANHFWESLGFVPVAFRAGSGKKKRVHIFWQKRINESDATTPYWYPSQTNSGAIRADRLVFPIPPGTHWKEVQAVAVPTEPLSEDAPAPQPDQRPALPPMPKRPQREVKKPVKRSVRPALAPMSGFRFQSEEPPQPAISPKPKKPKPAPAKINPEFLKAARELRDRYLEYVNSDGGASLLQQGKYEVARSLSASAPPAPTKEIKALPQAA